MNNIFRSSYKSITFSKNKNIEIFFNNKINKITKSKKIPYINNNKLNNFLMPKPVKVNTKKTKNKKSYDHNKKCKSFSNIMTSQDNNKENIENSNTLNTLRENSKNQKQKIDKNIVFFDLVN